MPAQASIPGPSHRADPGDAMTSRPVPARAAYATAPHAAQAARYPVRNALIRAARVRPAEAPLISRAHSTATGAADGSIIAAIMTTHSPRNGSSARPIVPGPSPIFLASVTVTAHAAAASAATAIHGTASWCRGRAVAVRAASAGAAASAMASAFVPEVGDEAVSPVEFGVPVAVIAHGLRLGLPEGLGDRAKRCVLDHRRPLSVHPDELVAAHRQSPGNLGVQRAAGPLERDRGRLDPGDLANQRAQPRQVTASTAREHRAQSVGLLCGGAVVQIQRHLPAAVGHPLR